MCKEVVLSGWCDKKENHYRNDLTGDRPPALTRPSRLRQAGKASWYPLPPSPLAHALPLGLLVSQRLVPFLLGIERQNIKSTQKATKNPRLDLSSIVSLKRWAHYRIRPSTVSRSSLDSSSLLSFASSLHSAHMTAQQPPLCCGA